MRIAKQKIVLAGMLLLASVGIFAAEQSPVDEFTARLAEITTLSGRFEQFLLDTDGSELQKTEGAFKMKRPGFFLWEVQPPFEQLVLGSPEQLKVYDADLEQMTVHAKSSFSASPALLLSGDVAKIADQYEVARIEGTTSSVGFRLSEKGEAGGDFDSLSFFFVSQKNASVLTAMDFVDKLGRKTAVKFSDLSLNEAIADTVFVFEPPVGTDIIINE